MRPTIYEALRAKLGREPTRAELRADVERIKAAGLALAAQRGQLPHQRSPRRTGSRRQDPASWERRGTSGLHRWHRIERPQLGVEHVCTHCGTVRRIVGPRTEYLQGLPSVRLHKPPACTPGSSFMDSPAHRRR